MLRQRLLQMYYYTENSEYNAVSEYKHNDQLTNNIESI